MPELVGPAMAIPRIEAIPDLAWYACAACSGLKLPEFLYYRSDMPIHGVNGYFCAPCIVIVAKKKDWRHTDVNLKEVVDAGRTY